MKKYIKNYFEHHGLAEDEIPMCEVDDCRKVAVDIHHKILKSQGGTDEVDNLIAVCRKCHEELHHL